MLAENIKKIRTKKGLSQTDLAQELFVTRQAISSWERGISEPDVQMLLKLCEIFDVQLAELIGEGAQKVYVPERKTSRIMLGLQLGLAMIVLLIFFQPNSPMGIGELIMLLYFPFMSGTLYLIFGYMFRTGDLSLLAGYDPKMSYVKEVFFRLLETQETWIHFINLITFSISLPVLWLGDGEELALGILWISYILSFIVGFFKIEDNYIEELYKEKRDRVKAEYQQRINLYLLGLILFPALFPIGYGMLFPDRASILGSVEMILMILVATLLPIFYVITEYDHLHKSVDETGSYQTTRMGKGILFFCVMINIIFVFLLIKG